MVRTWHFDCCDLGSVPGRGTKTLQAVLYQAGVGVGVGVTEN